VTLLKGQHVMRWMKIKRYLSHPFWRICSDWWKVCSYDRGYCFVSCSCLISLPVNGAPSHFFHCVPASLFREFPDHWRQRESPILWPTHSVDLTPLNVFFWKCLKDTLVEKWWMVWKNW
jgi:hypothetical protein